AQVARDFQPAARSERDPGPPPLRAHCAACRTRAHREAIVKTESAVRTRELDRTPDLVDLLSGARDAGHEVMLIERPMPEAVSVVGIGRALDLVASPGGVTVEDAGGSSIDFEPGENRILAASRAWRRHASTDTIAIGGFAYRPDRDPGGAWSGFPS